MNLLDSVVAFLETDVAATINATTPGLLPPEAVTGARTPARRAARRDKPHALSVEIALVGRRSEREGLASDRVLLELDLRVVLRLKDAPEGKEQASRVSALALALVRRYRGATRLPIVHSGTTFRWADARVVDVDEAPTSGEVARAVVRLALAFSEPLAAEPSP